MAVTVLDSTRIQISDWRPDSDTTYTHSGTFTVDGENLELTGFEIGDREILTLDGRTYKAIHHPTVMAATGPTTTYPLTASGKYFTTAHNDAFWCPRELSIMLRFKLVSATGVAVLIGKGADWSLQLDATNHLLFYDGSNGNTTSTLQVTPGVWSTVGLKIYDDMPGGAGTSTIKFWLNGSTEIQTVPAYVARPMGANAVYVSASYILPANNYVSAYWDYAAVWDEALDDNALENAMDYLKIQERGLILDTPFPYVTAATVTDLATAYEVEM